jgi:hypothetical protein
MLPPPAELLFPLNDDPADRDILQYHSDAAVFDLNGK